MSDTQAGDRWLDDAALRKQRLIPTGLVPLAQFATRSGLEFIADIANGVLPGPPMADVIGFVPIEYSPGRMVFQGEPGAQHLNTLGGVHGGYAATLLDTCLACAIHTALPAGKAFTTLELKVNYLRGMTARTGPVRAIGEAIHVGGQIAVAEGRIVGEDGTLYASATTTCLVFALAGAAGGGARDDGSPRGP